MLTKEDLQQIKSVVEDVVQIEILPLKNDIKEIKSDVNGLEKDTKIIKQDITKIRKDIDIIVNSFDRDYLDLRERVQIIEERLNIST